MVKKIKKKNFYHLLVQTKLPLDDDYQECEQLVSKVLIRN